MNKRKYLSYIMIIIGALSIIEWKISFSSLFLIGFMISIYVVFPMKKLCNESKFSKNIYNIYKVIIIILVSSFILVEGMIVLNISESKNNEKIDNIDTMIVLGAKVNGSKISENLKLRLDKAIDYYNKNNDINIIVSGGKTKNADITESLAMKNYLVSKGVNSSNIMEENKAKNTFENIIYSKKILDDIKNKGKVLIVTSDFHLFRGRVIASILGIDNEGLCSITPMSTKLYYMIREYPSSVKDIVKSIIYRYKF